MLHTLFINSIWQAEGTPKYTSWNSFHPQGQGRCFTSISPTLHPVLRPPSPCSALRVKGQVSHPYKTSDKIRSSVSFCVYDFGYRTGKTNDSEPDKSSHCHLAATSRIVRATTSPILLNGKIEFDQSDQQEVCGARLATRQLFALGHVQMTPVP
jgi:hypothetical protein